MQVRWERREKRELKRREKEESAKGEDDSADIEKGGGLPF